MKRNAMRALYLMLVLIPAPVALAQSSVKPSLGVFPGDTVSVTTSSALKDTDQITVNLKAVGGQLSECSSQIDAIIVERPSQNGFSFGVPPNLCTGQYQLSVSRREASDRAPEGVNISSPQYMCVNQRPPDVTGIDPKVLYRGGVATNGAVAGVIPGDTVATLVFLGPTSLKADPGYIYTVRFAGRDLPKCGTANTDPPQNDKSCYQQEKSEAGQVRFFLRGKNFVSDFSGRQSVSLVRNGAESSPQDLIVVDATKTTPRNYALGVTTALVVLVYLLLSAGRKALQATTSGAGTYLLKALFLDEETQTYSLSKCQFYAWTLTAILGYIFLAVAKSAIQGSAVFPEVPSGLPSILLASAGTSVVATAITSTRGSKGAGEVHPTLADFITTGCVVAPERLQFVVWTVVGILTFLSIVFKSDPLTLSDLPKVPDGFLQLMGISSAGYLGGKLARKAGPVVKVLSVVNIGTPNAYPPPSGTTVRLPVLTLNLRGENLDPKAKIKVDGEPLRGDQFWIIGTPDPQSQFCSELSVSLNEAAKYIDTSIKDSHTLTVVNSDAQAADVIFPIDPMTIESVEVSPLPSVPPAPVNVVVRGKNFVTDTTFEWRDPTGAPVAGFAPAPATVQNSTQLTVTGPPAAVSGSGYKLILRSPVLLEASKKV